MTELPQRDRIDGADDVPPPPSRFGLIPGPSFFLLSLIALILAMVALALIKRLV